VKRPIKAALALGGALALALAAYLALDYAIKDRLLSNEDPRFWEKDVAAIEARDPPRAGPEAEGADILFIGSSSILKWRSLEADMAPWRVVNHGFGGSKLADALYYYERLVAAYRPRAVVLYSGANDIHGFNATSKSAEAVLESVKAIYAKSRALLPLAPLYFVSVSPTRARRKAWPEADRANRLVAEWARGREGFVFIDATAALLDETASPNAALLQGDGLHLNARGYAAWASLIKPIVTAGLR
jgi:lysophospholipase L1-like esterase